LSYKKLMSESQADIDFPLANMTRSRLLGNSCSLTYNTWLIILGQIHIIIIVPQYTHVESHTIYPSPLT
jgi:hypothetical protein